MAIIWVATDGVDSPGGGSEDNPYLTIEYAITTMASGDQIRLKPGTYTPTATVSFLADGSLFSDVPGAAVIKPTVAGLWPSVVYANTARFYIYGVCIRQATTPAGSARGIMCMNVDQLLIHNCVVEDFGTCNDELYGIYVENCTGRIIGCRVEDLVDTTYASLINGIYVTGGAAGTSWVDVVDCTVKNLVGAGTVVRGIYNMTSLTYGP